MLDFSKKTTYNWRGFSRSKFQSFTAWLGFSIYFFLCDAPHTYLHSIVCAHCWFALFPISPPTSPPPPTKPMMKNYKSSQTHPDWRFVGQGRAGKDSQRVQTVVGFAEFLSWQLGPWSQHHVPLSRVISFICTWPYFENCSLLIGHSQINIKESWKHTRIMLTLSLTVFLLYQDPCGYPNWRMLCPYVRRRSTRIGPTFARSHSRAGLHIAALKPIPCSAPHMANTRSSSWNYLGF